MSLRDHLLTHRELLADTDRVRALVQAVRDGVRPGDVVVDVGTGSGVLAVAAARAGARRVYAIEAVDAVAELARQVMVDNGVADRVTVIDGHSTQVELPEKAQVLVAELVGAFGLEEDILRCVEDARRRFLHGPGRVIPDRLTMFAAPTQEGGGLNTWRQSIQRREGIDLAAVEARTRHLPRLLSADAGQLLGDGVPVVRCDLSAPQPAVARGNGRSTIARDAWLSGWVGWFEIGACGRPVLSTRPPAPSSSWGQLLLPVGEPIRVRVGDSAAIDIRFDQPFFSWDTRVGTTSRRCSEFEAVPVESLLPRVEPAVASR